MVTCAVQHTYAQLAKGSSETVTKGNAPTGWLSLGHTGSSLSLYHSGMWVCLATCEQSTTGKCRSHCKNVHCQATWIHQRSSHTCTAICIASDTVKTLDESYKQLVICFCVYCETACSPDSLLALVPYISLYPICFHGFGSRAWRSCINFFEPKSIFLLKWNSRFFPHRICSASVCRLAVRCGGWAVLLWYNVQVLLCW